MIEKILIFIVFLCPLIFFHELGHFLFARLFGVRVETFSIGFGPKLLKWRWRETEYTISLIPLGGYVKMFGDDVVRNNDLSEEDKKYAFNHKSKWARFWIVFGGPFANFVLAFVIFFFILLAGEKVPQTKFGALTESSFLTSAGIKSGDVLEKINNKSVWGILDLDLAENDKVTSVTIKDNRGEEKVLAMEVTFKQLIDEFMANSPRLRKSLMVDKRGNYYVISDTEKQIDWKKSLEETLIYSQTKLYAYRLVGERNEDSKKDPVFDPTSEIIINLDQVLSANMNTSTAKDSLKRLNIIINKMREKDLYPLDLVVQQLVANSPAEKNGLKKGDLIISLNKKALVSFDEMRRTVQLMEAKKPSQIEFLRNEKIHSITLVPDVTDEDGKKSYKLGIYSGIEFAPISYVHTPSMGLIKSFTMSFGKTWEAFTKTLAGFKKLIFHEVSFKNVGGPIAIGKVASDSFDVGISYFFKIMAVISVNLGIINLFPIPVLDGGHIFFLIIEAINRGPLSRRKMEIAQQFGLSLLFILIFAALYNDLARLFNF